MKPYAEVAALVALAVSLSACRGGMSDQPRYEDLEPSNFFADGGSARPLPANTIARGDQVRDPHFTSGKINGEPVNTFPMPITMAVLERGQERYNIYCSVCHGMTGAGQGMIVQRGFPSPPSFHIERLREAPVGHFFQVITHGYGLMYPYASRVEPADRWAIIAYIRALQLSQNATLEDVPLAQRNKLEAREP